MRQIISLLQMVSIEATSVRARIQSQKARVGVMVDMGVYYDFEAAIACPTVTRGAEYCDRFDLPLLTPQET